MPSAAAAVAPSALGKRMVTVVPLSGSLRSATPPPLCVAKP
jgi:hypothetical protein